MSTVKVRLQSPRNISLDHLEDTGIEWEEWEEMTFSEQQEVIEAAVWENIEAWVEDEED